jgi:branched-chain amino acid transport system substrate-binding protein
MRRLFLAGPGSLAALALLGPACGPPAQQQVDAVVVLGATEAGQRGAALAVEDLKKMGVRLHLVSAERGGDEASGGMSALLRIVEDSAAVAVVGLSSPEATLAAAHALEQRQVPHVIPDSTSVLLNGVGRWVFRICPSDRAQAELLASHAIRRGYRRVGILYALDDAGKGLAAGFSRAFARGGGEISLAVGHAPGPASPAEDVAAALEALRRTRSDALLLATATTDLARRGGAQALFEPGWPPRMGGGGVNEPIASRTDRALLEGMTVSLLAAPVSTRARGFGERYRQRFGAEPETPAYLYYDAVGLVGRAVADSGTTRGAVRSHLGRLGHDLPAHDGLAGPIRFDDSGQAVDPRFILAQVRGGTYETIEP